MTQPATGTEPSRLGQPACSPEDRVTKSLLGYGVIAGPVYVTASLAQAFTRDGFDLGRHEWSLLANGSLGWIQITNFIVTGLMVIAFAAGLRRALRPGVGDRWAPRLTGAYGFALVVAGPFRADPTLGFPIGTPAGSTSVTWPGMVHFVAAAAGFSCLAIACFVVARRYAAEGRPGWAIWSRLTGGLFLAGFALVAAGGGSRVANLGFTAAVILVWAWLSALAVERYHYVSATN
jgi:hypothetical protein